MKKNLTDNSHAHPNMVLIKKSFSPSSMGILQGCFTLSSVNLFKPEEVKKGVQSMVL